MKFKRIKTYVSLAAVLYLSGCASPAEYKNMVYMAPQCVKAEPSSKLHHAIFLNPVQGGKDTNPLWTSQVSAEDFQKALEISLQESGYLSKDKSMYVLTANLKNLKQPFFGFDMTVTSSVNYGVDDVKKDKKILNEDLNAEFTATVSDAFVGIARLRLANEGSIKENIRMLIEKLAQLNTK
ncbi:MAG TPA: hypothetical protein DIC42_04935 [Holosporales bacterium]|nr:hypothetical protein [Holosporales bacterium]